MLTGVSQQMTSIIFWVTLGYKKTINQSERSIWHKSRDYHSFVLVFALPKTRYLTLMFLSFLFNTFCFVTICIKHFLSQKPFIKDLKHIQKNCCLSNRNLKIFLLKFNSSFYKNYLSDCVVRSTWLFAKRPIIIFQYKICKICHFSFIHFIIPRCFCIKILSLEVWIICNTYWSKITYKFLKRLTRDDKLFPMHTKLTKLLYIYTCFYFFNKT